MPRRDASDCVRIARANISLVTRTFAAADMTYLRHALDLLETAVTEMRQAEAEVRAGMPRDPAKLRRETVLLKREIAGMMRVLDGCAALRRGLSVRLGCTAVAYTPQGREVVALPYAAASEMKA
jgi:hypothetical protein